jgi:succinate dehydrogenase/fumarate reductase-like Fe-S protein
MRLSVLRNDPTTDDAGRWETYEVPDRERMTVLDALLWVRRHIDPSLACRFSCRSANACKECLAVVNGQRTYMCTSVAGEEVFVQPLPNRELVRDLAVEP